jgi:CRP-like cAMP-binding protein
VLEDEAPADVVERELDLRAETPFAETEAELHQLLAIARHSHFSDGEHLFERGAPVSSVFMITQGEVELVLEGQASWRFINSGGIGFLDQMIARPYTRTAIARGDVRTLEIDVADFRDYMQDHADACHRILSLLAGTLFEEMIASPPALDLLAGIPSTTPDADEPKLVDLLLLLQRVPVFSRGTVQALANLAQSARVVKLAAGEVIAPAGAPSDSLSILLRGEAELVHPDGRVHVRRKPIDLVAHVAELSVMPRPLTARASVDSVVLQIDREELLDRLDEHFELVQSLFIQVAIYQEAFNDLAAAAGDAIALT